VPSRPRAPTGSAPGSTVHGTARDVHHLPGQVYQRGPVATRSDDQPRLTAAVYRPVMLAVYVVTIQVGCSFGQLSLIVSYEVVPIATARLQVPHLPTHALPDV